MDSLVVFALIAAAVAAQDIRTREEAMTRIEAKSAVDWRARSFPLEDARAQAALDAIAVPLDRSRAWTFTITGDDPGVFYVERALALTGGQVFVPAELIRKARSREELELAIAHAMAHVIAGHYAPTARRGGQVTLVGPRRSTPEQEREASESAAGLVAAHGAIAATDFDTLQARVRELTLVRPNGRPSLHRPSDQ